jgi:hypothetical protein
VILEESGCEVGGEPGAAARRKAVCPEDRRRDPREPRTHAERAILRRSLAGQSAGVARDHEVEDRLDRASLPVVLCGGRHFHAAHRRDVGMQEQARYGWRMAHGSGVISASCDGRRPGSVHRLCVQ